MREPGSGAGRADPPEIVFAPARPDVRPGHDTDVIFEVRRTSDGGRALPVFTAVERLVSALGPQQPWVALPLRNIQKIIGGAGVDRIVLDPDAESRAWRWQASDLQALERRQ